MEYYVSDFVKVDKIMTVWPDLNLKLTYPIEHSKIFKHNVLSQFSDET